jgi:YidC/Oxa1 family membrane protein insertase
MDRRRILTTVLIAAVIFLGFNYISSMWGGDKTKDAAATQAATQVSFAPAPTQPAAMETGATTTPIVLGDPGKASKDKLSLTVDPVTAGIKLVQLNVNDYAETVKGQLPLTLLAATPGVPEPYATLGIHLTLGNNAEELPLGIATIPEKSNDPKQEADRVKLIHDSNSTALYDRQYLWKTVKATPTETDLLLAIDDAHDQPLAEITKIFRIDPASYNVTVSHQVKNLSGQLLHVAIDEMAATTLPRLAGQYPQDDRYFHAASLSGEKNVIESNAFNVTQAEMQKLTTPSKSVGQFNEYGAGKSPFVWIACCNRFFAAITRAVPSDPAAVYTLSDKRAIPLPQHIAAATVDVLRHDTDPKESVFGVHLFGADVGVAPGSSIDLPLSVYFGPKDRYLLAGKEGSPVGSNLYLYDILQYASVIQFVRGGCFVYSFCSFDFIAKDLLWLLDFLSRTIAFHNYGIAIMILVVLIRAALHPLTRASQINMATMGQKMNKIKPLIEANKKRYADDKKKQQEEQMRIYRENNVNPAGGILGCLPMLIQMPIWIAMYDGLWADIDLRHASFIPGWINDLSQPDSIVHFTPFSIPLLSSMLGPISAFNLLPLLLAVVFYFQMKVQMASQPKAADPQQAQMQNMSKYMFFVVPLFLYTAPAGLNLYYFASTMAGLVDTYIVRKTLKKRGILPANAKNLPTDDEDEKD